MDGFLDEFLRETTCLTGKCFRGKPSGMMLDEIIAAAGGVVKLAEIANVKHPTISAGWRRRGQVSIDAAWRIHEALGIPLHKLRPDIFRSVDEAAG